MHAAVKTRLLTYRSGTAKIFQREDEREESKEARIRKRLTLLRSHSASQATPSTSLLSGGPGDTLKWKSAHTEIGGLISLFLFPFFDAKLGRF